MGKLVRLQSPVCKERVLFNVTLFPRRLAGTSWFETSQTSVSSWYFSMVTLFPRRLCWHKLVRNLSDFSLQFVRKGCFPLSPCFPADFAGTSWFETSQTSVSSLYGKGAFHCHPASPQT